MMRCRQLGFCLFLLVHLKVATIAMAQTIGTQSPLQGQSSRVEFNKSMVYIIAILIFIFFILGVISVYTRRCVDSHLRAHLGYRNFPFGDSSRRGLPPHVIDAFPTFIYSAVNGVKIGKCSVELECAVCLNVFEEDETLRLIPICNHVFHSQCIDVWLGSHSTCPVCRADLLSKHGDTASVAIEIQGTGHQAGEPDRRSELDHEMLNQAMVGTTSFLGGGNQNRLPSSRSTGFRLRSLFRRSHSTDHSSAVQTPNEDHERFTLRLPEEARDQLGNPSPNRIQSCVALPGESCPRKGYRSREEESKTGGMNDSNDNRFDQEERADKWRLTLASSFFNGAGSRETDHETDKETAF